MIERSYTTPDGCKITAYLERDAGDWSVGIPAGWSEDTCVVLEFDKCRVTLTWTDYDPEGRPIEAVEDYLIDFVDVEWNGELLADRSSDLFDAEPLLSLSELPEVLRVVQVALEAWNALERRNRMKRPWDIYWKRSDYRPGSIRSTRPNFASACKFARYFRDCGYTNIHLEVHRELD